MCQGHCNTNCEIYANDPYSPLLAVFKTISRFLWAFDTNKPFFFMLICLFESALKTTNKQKNNRGPTAMALLPCLDFLFTALPKTSRYFTLSIRKSIYYLRYTKKVKKNTYIVKPIHSSLNSESKNI